MQNSHYDRQIKRSNLENDHLLKKAKASLKKNVKKIARTGAAVATGGASLTLSKKGRTTLKKGAKAVGKAVKTVTAAAILAPLLPLTPVMRNALKKKGVSPPAKLADLAEAFYNNIVRQSNFDTYYSRPLHRDGYNNDHITGDIVMGIVQFVKSLLQKKKQAKAGGSVRLSPTENVIADGAEKVVGRIEEVAGAKGVSIDVPMPGSNSKDSNEAGGVGTQREQSGIEPTSTTMTGEKDIATTGNKKKGKKKSAFTPLLIAGGIAGAIGLAMAIKK